jgi:hypothetical protein
MLFLLMLLTAGYFAGVYWLRSAKRRASTAPAAAVSRPALPADDLPPAAAVGWPPAGARLSAYLDEGYAAIESFLSEDHRA